MKRNRENQRKVRERKKAAVAAASFNQPTTQNENQYLTSSSAGRPKSIDEDNLIRTKPDLALVGSSAELRRHTKVMNSCKSLDDLTVKLKDLGFNLSRSFVYLCLLPRRINILEKKRHKKVANVKSCRAMPMQRVKNPERWFPLFTIHYVEDLAVLMGRENVAILGKDDKALILLGITVAKK